MGNATTKSTARGGKLVTKEPAPKRGEPMYSTNKTAPKEMGGGPRDLSHSISSGAVPKEPNG